VRLGVGPAAPVDSDVLVEALADETDYALAEEHQRRAG
jgi:hypothetical protein